eukprot:scaffold302014_cov30-Tisochrysis_lutea.AAC.1
MAPSRVASSMPGNGSAVGADGYAQRCNSCSEATKRCRKMSQEVWLSDPVALWEPVSSAKVAVVSEPSAADSMLSSRLASAGS